MLYTKQSLVCCVVIP